MGMKFQRYLSLEFGGQRGTPSSPLRRKSPEFLILLKLFCFFLFFFLNCKKNFLTLTFYLIFFFNEIFEIFFPSRFDLMKKKSELKFLI